MNSSIYKTDKNGCPQVEGVRQGWCRQMGPSCHLLPPTPEPTDRHLNLKSLIIPPIKFLEFFFPTPTVAQSLFPSCSAQVLIWKWFHIYYFTSS